MAKAYKFDSGLTLLYENNKINKATSIEIAFDCGSRCDGDLPGLSHFCEHMFFTGTKSLSKQQVTKRYFDFIKTNAYTNRDEIVFTGTIMTNKLDKYLLAVQDMICNSTFKPSAVEEEKKVVIQEIAHEVDKHAVHASKLRRYEYYKEDYLKHGVLGSKETVNKITSKDVKNYVKKYFVKNNCVITMCSHLSFNRAKALVKKYFDDLMPSNHLTPLPYMQNRLIDEENVKVYHRDIDKNFFSIIFKFSKPGPDLKYRCVLSGIANMIDDISLGLTKVLRIDNSLVYSINADYMINNVNSYLELLTEISRENIKPCLDIIVNYINNITQHGFSVEQFKEELEKEEYYWQTKVDKPSHVRDSLSRYRFYGDFVSDKDIHDMVHKLTLEDINNELNQIFKTAKIQVFIYGNADKKDVYTIKQIKNKLNT